jgi:two-component system, OmpR family, response regulator ResD
MPTQPAVLISDDDAGIRNLLRTVTEKAGCRVETAANGLEAMQKMEVTDFDLLVLDLMMPIMDGFQVAERMRSIPRRPAVIVVTAGHIGSEELDRLDGRVVSSIMHKPFDIRQLTELVFAAADAVHTDRLAPAV